MNIATVKEGLSRSTVSPFGELIDYEYMYSLPDMNLKRISSATVGLNRLPSEALDDMGGLFDPRETDAYRSARDYVRTKLGTFDIAIRGTSTWPESLADSERPAPVLYYRGNLNLMSAPSVSVVGSRRASPAGMELASVMARELVGLGYHVATGLAAGIDTAAATSAIDAGPGAAIGVIGKPIDECYPTENAWIHREIVARGGLLVSQVPFYRYHLQPFKARRYYFPERNELMAAISDATLIVEASDTSGTLTQARACAHQGRPLFISRHCYDNPAVSWPRKWADKPNVYVVSTAGEIDDILRGGLLRDVI